MKELKVYSVTTIEVITNVSTVVAFSDEEAQSVAIKHDEIVFSEDSERVVEEVKVEKVQPDKDTLIDFYLKQEEITHFELLQRLKDEPKSESLSDTPTV